MLRRTSRLSSRNILIAHTSRHGIASLDRALVRCTPSAIYTDRACKIWAQVSDAAQAHSSRTKAATLYTSISVRQTACKHLVGANKVVHNVPRSNVCHNARIGVPWASPREVTVDSICAHSRPACSPSLQGWVIWSFLWSQSHCEATGTSTSTLTAAGSHA